MSTTFSFHAANARYDFEYSTTWQTVPLSRHKDKGITQKRLTLRSQTPLSIERLTPSELDQLRQQGVLISHEYRDLPM